MDRSKLTRLIEQKNERKEDDALRQASQIIDAIAREQQQIVKSNETIVALRKELADLEIEQIDPTAILD